MKNRLVAIAPTAAENPHASAALSKRVGGVKSGFGAKGGTDGCYKEKSIASKKNIFATYESDR